MGSTTTEFENVLDNARASLDEARDEYRALEQSHTVPEAIVESIAELEHELEELDAKLEISEDDIELVQQTETRVQVLSSVLSALRDRQRIGVEADTERLGYEIDRIEQVQTDLDLQLGDIKKKYSMLQQLVETERHHKAITSERLSIGTLEAEISDIYDTLVDQLSPEDAVPVYSDIARLLLDDIHEYLSGLGEQNDRRTAFASDLAKVKQLLDEAESKSNSAGKRSNDAYTALEGCRMLHRSISRAYAEQSVAESLVDTVRRRNLAVQCDLEECVEAGDAETLIEQISSALTTEVRQSATERLKQLLIEHDGSVIRTADATDLDRSTILDSLAELLDDDEVADITVEFN